MRTARTGGVAHGLRCQHGSLGRCFAGKIGTFRPCPHCNRNRGLRKACPASGLEESVRFQLLHRVVGQHDDVELLTGADALGGIDPAHGLDRNRPPRLLPVGVGKLRQDLAGRHRRYPDDVSCHGSLSRYISARPSRAARASCTCRARARRSRASRACRPRWPRALRPHPQPVAQRAPARRPHHPCRRR